MRQRPAKKVSADRPSRPDAATPLDLRRVTLLRVMLPIGAAAGGLCSWKLWISSHRLFPSTPVWSWLPQPPFPLDFAFAGSLLVLMAAVAVSARPARSIQVLLVLLAALGVLDQSRWQPWMVQYAVMFGSLLLFPWSTRPLTAWPANQVSAGLHACRLFMVCMYSYSGLEKLGYGFATVLPDIVAPLFRWLHFRADNLSERALLPLAIPLALVECASGVMLAFPQTRSAAAVCLILMHVALLWWLGPLGTNWNYVVWPWNLMLIGLLLLLFWRQPAWSLQDIWRSHWYSKVIALVFGVLPLLTVAGVWDSYLGFSVYTGNIKRAIVHISPTQIPELPQTIRQYTLSDGVIDIDRWCYTELGVPIYPETRVFVSVGRQVAQWLGSGARIRVIQLGRPDPFTGDRSSTIIDPLEF
jgi:hypothetical protein